MGGDFLNLVSEDHMPQKQNAQITMKHPQTGSAKVISGPREKVEFYRQFYILRGYAVVEDNYYDDVAVVDHPLPTTLPLF